MARLFDDPNAVHNAGAGQGALPGAHDEGSRPRRDKAQAPRRVQVPPPQLCLRNTLNIDVFSPLLTYFSWFLLFY